MLRQFALSTALALTLLAAAPSAGAQENLLGNTSFEEQFFTQVSADPADPRVIFNAPVYWWGGVITGGTEGWQNVHPTGYPHNAGFKRSGDWSFHMARGGATFTAYLYQQVLNIPAGTRVRGGAWAYMQSGQAVVRVGIATDGSTFPDAPSVVWSGWQADTYSWEEVSIEATATGDAVTLFLFATQPNPSDPNGTYWDDAYLYVVGELAAPVVPAASSQPSAPDDPSGAVFTSNASLRIRSGPGTEYAQVGKMSAGDAASVVGRTSFGWFQINFNGLTGWVAGNLGSLNVDLTTVPVVQPPA